MNSSDDSYKKDQGLAAAGGAGSGKNGGRELIPGTPVPSPTSDERLKLIRDLKRSAASKGE